MSHINPNDSFNEAGALQGTVKAVPTLSIVADGVGNFIPNGASTAASQLLIAGLATANAVVYVMDNSVILGSASTLVNGLWVMPVDAGPGIHRYSVSSSEGSSPQQWVVNVGGQIVENFDSVVEGTRIKAGESLKLSSMTVSNIDMPEDFGFGVYNARLTVPGKFEKHSLVGNLPNNSSGQVVIVPNVPCRKVSFYYNAYSPQGGASVEFWNAAGVRLGSENLKSDHSSVFSVSFTSLDSIVRVTLVFRAGASGNCLVGLDNVAFE